jgi:predicted RND superfamily exporter protein
MIKRLAEFITRYCFVVFWIFLVLAAICGLLSTKVKINHNIYSYMPADSETTLGLAIMNDEFDYSSTSSWQIMFKDLKDGQAEEIKSYIEGVAHVKKVVYDDSEDHVREQDGHKYDLFQITVNAPSDSPDALETYNEVYGHFNNKYDFSQNGDVFLNNGSAIEPVIIIFAIACAMVILTMMSESLVEPWLYLFAIMIAVLFNKGTNLLLPDVSHITDGISMILQMALSMDYAIMLSSRYRQEKDKINASAEKSTDRKANNRLAMQRALRYSFSAISSSSITTVVGLIVLVFMSFTIGRDMGIVLSKGVILSLVSIFTILPALLLFCDKAIEKTKKKILPIRVEFLGKFTQFIRRFALPLFIGLFVAAFLLKGNTSILFTSTQNNKIKDIFPVNNQTALVYDNSEEEKVKQLCEKFGKREDVAQILCYSNTLGEAKKYDEIVDKANALKETKVSGEKMGDGEKITTDNYIIKALYYYYFRGDGATMSLPEVVTFIQNEVIPDEKFADEVSANTKKDIDRFSNFVINEKMNRPRSKAEMAALLEVDPSVLNELYTLYLAEHPSPIKLTLHEFATFVTNEVLTNPDYAKLVTSEQRWQLGKLLLFSNPNVTGVKKNATQLAQLFDLNTADVEQLITYYLFTSIDTPTVGLTPEELANYALSNATIRDELGVTEEDAQQILDGINSARQKAEQYEQELETKINEAIDNSSLSDEEKIAAHTEIAELIQEVKNRAEAITKKQYTYADFVSIADRIKDLPATVSDKINELNEKYGLDIKINTGIDAAQLEELIDKYLEKIKELYKLYQAETSEQLMTPAEFVDFLLAHKDDERLNGALTADKVELLKLVQYVIRNQKTRYSYQELATTFNLDEEKLRLVYALYDSRHVHTELALSPKTVVEFLVNNVLSNPEYASRLNSDQRAKIYAVADLMHAAIAGTQYDYDALYRALLPLSRQIDRNQIFLAYLYHGSLYDYDESWSLTLEQLVHFLYKKILNDNRFVSRIDDDMRTTIEDGWDMMKDAKEMLVGEKHSRALIETHLPEESPETFAFLQSIKDEMGDGVKTKYFVIGDSAMAYEISQTFSGELDFITVLTMLSIFVVVAVTFKSILIPFILVMTIQSAVYINMAYLSLTNQSIYFIALIIVQSILMGATIDYAILYTSYYLENRKYFKLDVKDAVVASYKKSIHSILTSASILILVTAIVGNFATAIAAKICQSISGGTLVSCIIILLLLPALLATLDRLIIRQPKKK